MNAQITVSSQRSDKSLRGECATKREMPGWRFSAEAKQLSELLSELLRLVRRG